MKNKTALFILNTLICLLLVSCGPNTKAPHDASQPIEEVFASDSKPYYISKPLKLEMIMSEVDHGLSKIKLDDSTTLKESAQISKTEDLIPVISFTSKASKDEEKKHSEFIDRMKERGYTNKQIKLLTDWYLRVRKAH